MDEFLGVHVRLLGHERIDFDRKKIRKAMRVQGGEVRKVARRLVARRAVSGPGEAPGRDTGALYRSIKSKVSRSGFLVKVAPQKTSDMGDEFYPAFLYYGVRAGGKRSADHRKKADGGNGWRIEKRDNYMSKALDQRRAGATAALETALKDSLIPR
jgi:hypothetical protein